MDSINLWKAIDALSGQVNNQNDVLAKNHKKTLEMLDEHLQRAEAAENYKGKFERVESRYDWLEEQLKAQAESNPNEVAEQALEQVEKLSRKLEREMKKADENLQETKEKLEGERRV